MLDEAAVSDESTQQAEGDTSSGSPSRASYPLGEAGGMSNSIVDSDVNDSPQEDQRIVEKS